MLKCCSVETVLLLPCCRVSCAALLAVAPATQSVATRVLHRENQPHIAQREKQAVKLRTSCSTQCAAAASTRLFSGAALLCALLGEVLHGFLVRCKCFSFPIYLAEHLCTHTEHRARIYPPLAQQQLPLSAAAALYTLSSSCHSQSPDPSPRTACHHS